MADFNKEELLSVEKKVYFIAIFLIWGGVGVKGRGLDSIPATTIGYKRSQRGGKKKMSYAP